jgi:molybdopterin molybdotransferase
VADLLTIDEALARVLEHARLLPVEEVQLDDSLGRIVREPTRAVVDLPPFPSSAMDGFAVRASDTPGELAVAFRVAAGSAPPGALPTAAAAGIATGGTVPVGADAVVPVEVVDDRGDVVAISAAASAGQHIRPRGGDVHADDVVAAAGTRVGPVQLGALAAAGVPTVRCSVRPHVAVLATGSELRSPGEALGPGQIYESNRGMIGGALAGSGAIIETLPVVADDVDAHRTAFERALQADVVVTSGGVSMGPHDLVRRVAADLGVEEVFWGVAIKPGKPLAFGVRESTLVFGLPGNPVSSLVGALVFVRTALLAIQGAARPEPPYLHGRLSGALRRNPHRDEFVRARRTDSSDGTYLEAVSGQESHMIVRAATSDALVHVPRGEGEIPAGGSVRFLALDG